jgi:hypothetical protein
MYFGKGLEDNFTSCQTFAKHKKNLDLLLEKLLSNRFQLDLIASLRFSKVFFLHLGRGKFCLRKLTLGKLWPGKFLSLGALEGKKVIRSEMSKKFSAYISGPRQDFSLKK